MKAFQDLNFELDSNFHFCAMQRHACIVLYTSLKIAVKSNSYIYIIHN